MISITQLIYIKEGEEKAFHQFEEMAIPLISKYKGSLLLRVRPGPAAVVEKSIALPYEIHLVEFEAEADFQAFMQDPERKKFLYLKEQSVRDVVLIKGEKLNA
jgi:uncharacterized protein (DUF1330 family)